MRLRELVVYVGALVLASACGDSSSPTGDSSSGDGGAAAGGAPAGGSFPGDPHTPAAGCQEGYVPCGDVCAHLEDDARHCGECDNPCNLTPELDACVAGACTPGTPCPTGEACPEGQGCQLGMKCDGACVSHNVDIDNCGSCENRCADAAICLDGACLGSGSGESCADPLEWDANTQEDVGFRFAAGSATHVFSCGSSQAVPARFFRVNAPQEALQVQAAALDDTPVLIEVFDADSCDSAASVACAPANAVAEAVSPMAPIGTPYWIAVGLSAPATGQAAVVAVDN